METAVVDKDAEISCLQNKEIEKDLRFQAQNWDFHTQQVAEQTACKQVTNTLEGLHQELEALKEAQHGPNPMEVSLTDTNNELACERDKAKEESANLPKH